MSMRELLRHNDERFCAHARALSADDWTRPSLCDAWTNHEVLAHLVVGLCAAPGSMAAALLRHQGIFDNANAEMATSMAARRSAADLLDDFERLSRRPRGLGRYFPSRLLLGDHVTHELDIMFALGRESDIAHDALIAVLNTQVSVPNPFVPAFRNARGLRLRTTDAAWRHGERGPVVKGRAAYLVSVLGNRPQMLERLRGEGVVVLESRLSRPTRTVG
jgi:uncharacterized protein (TIGR03083 family)